MKKYIILSLALGLFSSSVFAQASPNPTIRLKQDPSDNKSVIVYVDWQNLAGETDAYINSISVCIWASSAAGEPTITNLNSTSGWARDAYHDETTVDGGMGGAANNPDNLEFRRYRTTTLLSFGDVSAAGTEDDLFKLTFPTGAAGLIARLLEGNNGSGGNAMDNTWSTSFKPVNEYSENGNSSYTAHDGIQSSPTATLPVDLVSFDVNTYNAHDAKLDWATASELNNSHFEVQRSFDGYNFSTIGEVKGNGTSHALINYNYIDKTIPTHENMVYYRLNQVDFDGESALTDVRLVQFEGFSNTPLIVYPNPTRNETTILLGNNVSQGNYTITDLVGKQWMADVVQSGSKSIQLDFSNLPSGVYIATLNADGQDSRHVRIVKH